jgi:hypothetical protein
VDDYFFSIQPRVHRLRLHLNGVNKQASELIRLESKFLKSPLSGTTLRVPKKPGESCLKPAKNKNKTHLLLKHAHKARPAPRWPPRLTGVAQSKAPSSRFRFARGLTPPSRANAPLEWVPPRSRASTSLERVPPRSRASASLDRVPPRSRLPHKRTYSRARVRAFNALHSRVAPSRAWESRPGAVPPTP